MACLVLPQAKAFKEFQRGAFAGDDKFSVDRLVDSCQPKSMPALPSAGRELVPYFRSPDDCVNETLTQSKADSARKRKKSGKKSPAASTHLSLVDSRDSSPGKATIKRAAQKLQDANLCGDCIQSKRSFPQGVSPQGGVKRNTSARTPTASAKDLKAWAGPSYCTSPPPEHLPMPTAFLLAV